MTYTPDQKFKAVEREIKMRRRAYPRWVAEGRMTQENADKEISIMESIREEYKAQIEGERLL